MDFVLCFLVLGIFTMPRTLIMGYARVKKERYFLFIVGINLLQLLDLVITSSTSQVGDVFRLTPLLRPLLFVVLIPPVRRRGVAMLRSVKDVAPILLTLSFLLMLYAWIGMPVSGKRGRDLLPGLFRSVMVVANLAHNRSNQHAAVPHLVLRGHNVC